MGAAKSKELFKAPSARVVLARRQQEMDALAAQVAAKASRSNTEAVTAATNVVADATKSSFAPAESVPESKVLPDAASTAAAPVSATQRPVIDDQVESQKANNTMKPSEANTRRVPFEDPAMLNSDILKEVSKWSVVKKVNNSEQSMRVKSTTHIRQELQEKESKGTAPSNSIKLSELQIHDLFKTMRDSKTIDDSQLANTFSISTKDLEVLKSTARYPTIVADPDDADSKIAY